MKHVTCPRNCFDGCMFVYKDGVLIPDRDNPGVDGITCPKSQYILKVREHPERITKPLLRDGSGWRKITLDEALSIVTKQIERKSRTVRVDYSGNMMLLSRRFHHRLFHVLGAPDIRWDICAEAGSEGLKQSWGIGYGMDIPDMKGADVVVIWGANVQQTSVHAFTYAMQTKTQGGKVFVVDVIESETAKHFDLIKVKPGGDVAFAIMIVLALRDMGFEVPIDIDMPLEDLEFIAGVPFSVAQALAKDLSSANKPFIFMGYGFQRRRSGFMAVRLISLIPYITHRKRLFYYDRPAYGVDNDYIRGAHLATGEVFSLTQLYRHIEHMENTVFVVMNINPVNTLPRGDVIARVFDRPSNFVVVHDLFMTDTAAHADLIIPAAASVEYEDIMVSYGHGYIGWNEAIFDKPPHTITNMDFAREVAKRLGLRYEELYEDDISVITYVLNKLNISLSELKKKGFAPLPPIPARKEPIFPSWDEIEKYIVPRWEGKKFILLTPSYRYRIHSQYWLFNQTSDEVLISSTDAKKLGIKTGDKVVLKNKNGEVVATARVSEEVISGVLKMFHGNWGSTVGTLINDGLSDVGPNSMLSDTFVSIEKCQ